MPVIALPVLIAIAIGLVTLIGLLVFYFDKISAFFTSTPFLIGLGVILALIFFKFVSGFLMGVLLPLFLMIVNLLKKLVHSVTRL